MIEGPRVSPPHDNVSEPDPSFDASQAYALIASERAKLNRHLAHVPSIYYVTWGVVWLLGQGMMFLAYGPHDAPLVPMPAMVPGVVLAVLVGTGVLVSVVTASRTSSRIGGASTERGVMYGLAWFGSFLTFAVVGARVTPHLPTQEAVLFWSALSTAIVGTLYVAGAAVWQARPMFALGLWVLVVDVLAILAGPGWHSLIISIAVGGGLVVTGIIVRLRASRVAVP
jgi:hypothetical protein